MTEQENEDFDEEETCELLDFVDALNFDECSALFRIQCLHRFLRDGLQSAEWPVLGLLEHLSRVRR